MSNLNISESALQEQVWTSLAWKRMDALYFHPTNEGKRTGSYGAKLKRMGLVAGVPDLCFTWATGSGYIELKTPKAGKTLKKDQLAWQLRCQELGINHAVCTSGDEVDEALKQWGIV